MIQRALGLTEPKYNSGLKSDFQNFQIFPITPGELPFVFSVVNRQGSIAAASWKKSDDLLTFLSLPFPPTYLRQNYTICKAVSTVTSVATGESGGVDSRP